MTRFLNFFNKKYFLTFIGLFIFLTITFEPLIHDHHELDHEKEIELDCNFCSFDVSDDVLYIDKKEQIYLLKSPLIKDFKITFTDYLNNFNPRAPPKN